MSSFAVLTLLLTITVFYVFLCIYILVHVVSRRAPSFVKAMTAGKKKMHENSSSKANSPLW